MAINKVGSKGIEDGSVAAVDFAPGTITDVKLNATLDISGNTVTLPNTSVTSDMLANTTVANAKLSNSSVTIAGTAIALGASGTFNNKFVDWQSIVVSNGSTVTTMVSGRGYFINNTSAAGLVKLPISASIGDFVAIKDYAGNFGTNSLTIQRNGHNIQGVANDSLISTNRASLVLVYVDATKGWIYWEEHNVDDLQAGTFITATGGTVTESGDFKVHSFTGDANFVVSAIGNSAGGPNSVDHLVIAGGGSGGSNYGGGGGAGGYRTSFPSPAGTIAVTAQTYPVTVGGGGAAVTGSNVGTVGSNSVFSTITSAGGGYGAGDPGGVGGNGGSGGGGGSYHPGAYGFGAPSRSTAGSGNTPPVSPSQGNNGGYGLKAPNGTSGGAGGGAGAVGGNAQGPFQPYGASQAGDGGAGAANSITGSSVTRAGGGGGATEQTPGRGTGGSGGGGDGGTPSLGTTAGTANTGGGGGARTNTGTSGAGGSGIVIIRYKFQ